MAKVLIVDDAAVDRRFAAGLVEEATGIQVLFAEDGEEALEQIALTQPDVVVTDLQMPKMDGLELVTRVRLTSPDIPVVLMTAKGSEEIAVQALDHGASSYVPKSQLGKSLRDTVENLLAITKSDRTYAQLAKCEQRVEREFELENDPALVDALTNLVQREVEKMQLTDHTGKFRIGVAFREALANALYRGNLELSGDLIPASSEEFTEQAVNQAQARAAEVPYCDRRIRVLMHITRDEARFTIQDEGPGFNPAEKRGSIRQAIGGQPESGGRGMVLMDSFMDEVAYNERGNEVVLIKRRDGTRSAD